MQSFSPEAGYEMESAGAGTPKDDAMVHTGRSVGDEAGGRNED